MASTRVTTRLQRKSRNTSLPSGSNDISTRSNAVSAAPMQSVSINNVPSSGDVKEEIDPLSTNSSLSPTLANAAMSIDQVKVKIDPDGDVIMKTESVDGASTWPTSSTLYPPNGLNVKHVELKVEDIKQEKLDDANKPEAKDETKINESEDKENEDGEMTWPYYDTLYFRTLD